MVKIFCDRCGKEITNADNGYYSIHSYIHRRVGDSFHCDVNEGDICDECYNEFEEFMDINEEESDDGDK